VVLVQMGFLNNIKKLVQMVQIVQQLMVKKMVIGLFLINGVLVL